MESEYCDTEVLKCVDRECYSDLDCALEHVCLERKCEIDVEADRDQDSVPDVIDLCPTLADRMQEDSDLDMIGDACDEDDDRDGVIDVSDNCRLIKNPNQGDADFDGEGNACDLEIKGTDLVGRLNALEIKLSSYVGSTIELLGSPISAMIQEDGFFKFEQAVTESPNISLKINLKGYEETLETAYVNLKTSTYDLGRIDLLPLRVDLKGKVYKELSNQHDQIMVSSLINQQ